MYTSYYAKAKSLPKELRPVAISVGLPKWWNGDSDKRLAPTWKMLKSSREVYDIEFKKALKKLDARKIYEELGDNAVLICYETPNDWCHRRAVAEWFEEELGIEVPEYGLDRKDSFPYEQCNEANKGKKYSEYISKQKAIEEFQKEVLGEEEVKPKQEKDNERQMTFFDLL